MRVLIIRHAPVGMAWEKKYTSEDFDLACRNYQCADIIMPESSKQRDAVGWKVYVSPLKRSADTAHALYSGAEPTVLEDLKEVPLRSYRDTDRRLPVWLWKLLGRVQWFFGSGRQPESRRQTLKRAKALVKTLEKADENCILVTHGFFMHTLLNEFRKAGFCITGSGALRIQPLDRFRAAKWSEHCGGCRHNCLLTNPGCNIGKEKLLRSGRPIHNEKR